MRSTPSVLAAVAWGFMLQSAAGADLGEPSAERAPAALERAFYIRGDFGYADHQIGAFSQEDVISNGGGFVSQDFGDAPYIGIGFGVRLARWLRFDLTGEYRFSSNVNAVDNLDLVLENPDGQFSASTTYSGKHTAVVGLANVYVDLPKWHVITPYIGGGVGFARNRFSAFTTASDGSFEDFATGQVDHEVTAGFASSKTSTNFAWALMAGAVFDLDVNTKLDIGYRYVNLGSDLAVSTDIINCHCRTIGSPLTGSDLESHEVRIGLRYEFSRVAYDSVPLK